MARSFWKGNVSFGLVEIPVRLQPAVESKDLSFTQLDRTDFSPIGYRRYNKNTGREVSWEDVVRGYEHEPDEYVVLTDEELRRANVEATQSIEILEFVELADIDPMFFDQPYFVEPVRKDSKSYALLREVLRRSGKAAIARVVLRTWQRLAALVARGPVLVLDLLRWEHELRDRGEVRVPETPKQTGVSERELQMAERLVAGMSGRWDPQRFRDEYREDVLALVERKVKSGETHTLLEPETGEKRPRRRAEVVDLMSVLKRSLESRVERDAPGEPAAAARRPAARARKPVRGRPAARSGSSRAPGRESSERRRAKSA